MFSDREFKDKLISDDIIVWNGVVTRYGCIKHFVNDGDMLRMANEEEVDHYKGNQGWHDMRHKKSKLINRIMDYVNNTSFKPTHFHIVRAVESIAIQYIPNEWISNHHLDSYVAEYFDATGKQVGVTWLGHEFFELPLREKYPMEKLKTL